MTVTDYEGGKMITLSKAFDTRAKKLNIVYFIVFSSFAVRFISMFASSDFELSNSKLIAIAVLIIIVVVYLFAGYKFLNKSLETEKIIATRKALTITKSGFLSKQSKSYDPQKITHFRHLDKAATSTHTLAGQSFDYLGFQTQQQVIAEMHGDKRLAFDYNDEVVKFGENIYSWEYEELTGILIEATDQDLTRKGENINYLEME